MKIPKYLTAGAVLTLALTATGVSASAQTTTATTTTTTAPSTSPATPAVPANLAPDQLVLTGTCIPDTTIVPEAQDAMALYVPFGPPAGVYINGNWVPAAYLAGPASGNYIVGAAGCTNPVAPPTSVPIPTTTTTS
jgi:hypothetical protein